MADNTQPNDAVAVATDDANATLESVATDSDQSALAWCSLATWESSGFLAFLAAHAIQRSDLLKPDGHDDEQRFFRMKQHGGSSVLSEADVVALVVQSLEKEGIANTQPTSVAWLQGFYSLPVATPLARINLYKQGELYGIDISSGYAVTLLNIQPGEHVLDLCCAPGAKLTMMADLLELSGSVTGVDFSRQRIGACKQLVHKYKLIKKTAAASEEATLKKETLEISGHDSAAEKDTPSLPATSWRCRLFHADGRTFNIGPKTECEQLADIETVLDTEEIAARGSARGQQQRKRKNKSARARDAKRPKVDVVHDAALYDKVLVDAECTHDGSIRHLQKNDSLEKWKAYVENHLNDSEIERILKLQHALIRNGFKMLKAGGEMIYSTCSLSVKQNEDIVREFLKDEPGATLLPIDRTGIPCQEGRLAGTARFTPAQNTSGLFIAKIRKANAIAE
ncbi:tRNA cytosine-5-methylases and related enzymes of the nol1/nop2/sun superfamily, partial [Globisporangium splendens]